MLIKLPRIDRKSSLLAGFEVGPIATVEVDLGSLGEDRVAVIEALELHSDGTATLGLVVTTPTVEAIVEAVRTAAAAEAGKRETRERAWRELLQEWTIETARINGLDPVGGRVTLHAPVDGFTRELGEYDGYVMPPFERASVWDTRAGQRSGDEVRATPEYKAHEAAVAALAARVERLDSFARMAALPALTAAYEQRRAREKAEAEHTKQAKQAEQVERAAERLRTGHWERETGSYNPRRYRKPWCARVTGVDMRGKLVYEWGQWTGRFGEPGLLRVPCKPGEIIAWGQSDNRGSKGTHSLMRMEPDGTMISIAIVDAVRAMRSAEQPAQYAGAA